MVVFIIPLLCSAVKRSQSMEQLHINKRAPGTPILGKGRITPAPSPRMTPRSRRRFGLSRRNSEPDLEAAGEKNKRELLCEGGCG